MQSIFQPGQGVSDPAERHFFSYSVREVTTHLRNIMDRYPIRKIPLFFFLLLFFLVFAIPVAADTGDDAYLKSLLAAARKKNLHEDRYWHILLHYEKGPFGISSLIDDPKFFLSPKGKHDPRAELEAAINTFFHRDVKENDFDICQFIARYTWLKEVLEVDGTRVRLFECDAVNQVAPMSATLIFPTYYMNNPASMFGHTLINIETEYASKLLTKSVNYSAFTQETNGLLFAVKGLFGFYEGYYTVLPYYMKIQQYSDISQRDIWEYRLNLTVPELERMVRHIRELEDIYADYFFFDENCSYNLLYLLEAARPSLHLTDQFSVWAIPIDTVRVAQRSDIVESAEFRPSKASKIRHKFSLLSENGRNIALEIIRKKRKPATVLDLDIKRDEKIVIIDFVAEYVGYQYAKKKMTKERYQTVYLETLKLRSSLGQRDEPYKPVPPPPPEKGHASRKFDMGMGTNLDDSFFEIAFRPAFSDLLDTDYGYHQGTQIKFFDTRLRYYFDDEKVVLDKFNAIDIVSISPRDRLFKPLSWKVSAGVCRETMADEAETSVFKLNTGGGLAYYHKMAGLFYAFFEPEFQYSPDLEKNFSFGGGFSAGTVMNITDWWKCHLSARQIFFEYGDEHDTGNISIAQNIEITTNNHIRVEASREKTFDTYNNEAQVNWSWFF